jgi:hypothetical protein
MVNMALRSSALATLPAGSGLLHVCGVAMREINLILPGWRLPAAVLVWLRFLAANGAGLRPGSRLGYAGCGIDALQTSPVIEFPADVDVDLQSLIKYHWQVGIGSIATSAGS